MDDKNFVVTVRILDWRREPCFGINECPSGVDIPKREWARFEKEFQHYSADRSFKGPREIRSQRGMITMTKVLVDFDNLLKLTEAIDIVFNRMKITMDKERGKNAFIYSILNRYFNIKNNVIVGIFEELGLDVTYMAMANFLSPKTDIEKQVAIHEV